MPYQIPNYNPFERKMTALQQAVADEYLVNGFNKRAAYRKFRPDVSQLSTCAASIFNSPCVIEYINKKMAAEPEKTESLKQQRIKRMEHLSHTAEKKKQLGHAITAHKEICAMEGHYRDDRDKNDIEQYQALLQKISVTVNVNSSDQKQIINMEAQNDMEYTGDGRERELGREQRVECLP